MTSIKNMSVRHDAIAEFLIANPGLKLGEVALHFGVTQPWLSRIVHSDIFQSYYKRMRGDYVDSRIMPLRDKLLGIAHQAVDKLGERVETVTDPRILLDIADKTMGRLGYGQPKAPPGITINNNSVTMVTPAELEAARERYRALQEKLSGDAPIEGEVVSERTAAG